jgi:hypothetical protein
MDFYLFSLILGFVGLGIMAFSGLASNHGTSGGHQGHAQGHGPAHGGHGHHVGDVSPGHGGHAHGPALHAGHGAAHAGHDAHAGSHAPAGPHVHHGPLGHDLAHGDGGHDAGGDHGDASEHGAMHGIAAFGLSLLSPRVLFSILVGLGLTGMVAREWLGGALLALVGARALGRRAADRRGGRAAEPLRGVVGRRGRAAARPVVPLPGEHDPDE